MTTPSRPPETLPKHPLLPLKFLLADLLLVSVAAVTGITGLALHEEWLLLLGGFVAVLAFPIALACVHWLRWLIDIPALLLGQSGWRLLMTCLHYIADVFVSLLIFGWLALVLLTVAGGLLSEHEEIPGWVSLTWGFAITSGPLTLMLLRPSGYPLLFLLCLLGQLAYPIGWGLIQWDIDWLNLMLGVLLLALIAPLLGYLPAYRRAARFMANT